MTKRIIYKHEFEVIVKSRIVARSCWTFEFIWALTLSRAAFGTDSRFFSFCLGFFLVRWRTLAAFIRVRGWYANWLFYGIFLFGLIDRRWWRLVLRRRGGGLNVRRWLLVWVWGFGFLWLSYFYYFYNFFFYWLRFFNRSFRIWAVFSFSLWSCILFPFTLWLTLAFVSILALLFLSLFFLFAG